MPSPEEMPQRNPLASAMSLTMSLLTTTTREDPARSAQQPYGLLDESAPVAKDPEHGGHDSRESSFTHGRGTGRPRGLSELPEWRGNSRLGGLINTVRLWNLVTPACSYANLTLLFAASMTVCAQVLLPRLPVYASTAATPRHTAPPRRRIDRRTLRRRGPEARRASACHFAQARWPRVRSCAQVHRPSHQGAHGRLLGAVCRPAGEEAHNARCRHHPAPSGAGRRRPAMARPHMQPLRLTLGRMQPLAIARRLRHAASPSPATRSRSPWPTLTTAHAVATLTKAHALATPLCAQALSSDLALAFMCIFMYVSLRGGTQVPATARSRTVTSMTADGSLIAASGRFWPLLAASGRRWPPMAASGRFWPLPAPWQVLIMLIGLRWRYNLTRTLHSLYFTQKAYVASTRATLPLSQPTANSQALPSLFLAPP